MRASSGLAFPVKTIILDDMIGASLSYQLGCMAGVAGFEPANGGIKTRCLATWRHPNETAMSVRDEIGIVINTPRHHRRH